MTLQERFICSLKSILVPLYFNYWCKNKIWPFWQTPHFLKAAPSIDQSGFKKMREKNSTKTSFHSGKITHFQNSSKCLSELKWSVLDCLCMDPNRRWVLFNRVNSEMIRTMKTFHLLIDMDSRLIFLIMSFFKFPNKVKNGVIEDGLNVSIEKNRERESKWLLMLANWNLYSKSKKYQSKLKNRVRKGIPDAIRGKAWMFLR